MGLHWDSWAVRVALLGLAGIQVVSANTSGAVVAGEGFVVSLVPLAIERLSKTHVPRPLEFAFVVGMALQFSSESTKLFELFTYWDKIVHPTLIAITALVAGWFVLGYRDAYRKRLPIHLAAAFSLLLAMSTGAFWEFIEFGSDWFGDANLQKSNGDTLTDLLANDLGAFVATLFGLWVYTHLLSQNQRQEMGHIAHWLANGPARLLDRYGRIAGALAAVVVGAIVFYGLWIDRGTPALASGLTPGQTQSWTFGAAASSAADTSVLSGDWVPDERGMCRVNAENPRPGSEKIGVLELAPGKLYGQGGQPFSIEASYFEQQPLIAQGTEMNAGIAFGIRDPENFDLLEQSALHDFIRVDRYVHGKRRDLREELLRTHANDWHVLRLDVVGSTVKASIDGRLIFATSGVPDTDGGVGLWARAAAAACFSEVHITTGEAAGG